MPLNAPVRIGILLDSLLSRYQIRLFNGAKRVARRLGARLIGFQGSYLTNAEAERPVFDGSFLYDLAGPECVDGLLVVTNVLAGGVGPDAVSAFCKRSGLCVVSIGQLRGFPHIEIDNRGGLRNVIEHLVEQHGRKRLAFIRGTAANPDSVERECVFRATLDRLGLRVEEDWILPGNFLEASGATAIRTLFDLRKVPTGAIDGIVAGNDQMACGAVRELSFRGLRVPRDLSVVGFDDDDHARNNSPPLTTVAQPVERIAERAVELLLDRIAGRDTPERTLIEAKPIWRRSCGCSSSSLTRPRSAEPAEPLAPVLGRRRAVCLEQLERLVGPAVDAKGVDALIELVCETDETRAMDARDTFELAVIETSKHGIDALRWHDVLEPIEDAVGRFSATDSPGAPLAQRRLLDAQLLVNEITARTRMIDQLYNLQLANGERVLGSALACARDFAAMGRVLGAGLSRLGIGYCCVCSFVGTAEPRLARVTALYDPVEPPASDILQNAEQLWRAVPESLPPSQAPPDRQYSTFPARELVSARAASTAAEIDLLLYPLVFAKDALGYVVFEAPLDVQRAWVLEGLAGHLSGAVFALQRAEELRRAREVAESANAAKSEFVAVMSHEVRTPLTAIIGHVDLCLQTQLSRDQRAHLTRARASSRALLGIVNDILDFSKIEAHKLALESVPFDLDEVLDQVIGSCALPAARKGLEFVVDVDPDVPRKLTGDPLRLTQVLLNLVGNAIKFSHAGHVILRASRGPGEEPGTLHFSVRDTGIGMSREQLALVFNPFTQADGSMTRRYGGTGLGLTISRRLVELMGGRLTATSELDRGSEFSFDCRCDARHVESARAPALAGARVLVVEDSEPAARALDRLLLAAGYEVTLAETGNSALARFAESAREPAFDFVLIDQGLPDFDGLELARRIRERFPSPRCSLLLLGESGLDGTASGGAREPDDLLVVAKPVQRRAVLAAIGRAHRKIESTPPQHAGTEVTPLRQRRVLVVQDDEISRDVTRQVLERAGAQVELAATGSDAVACATRGRFDLILMDVHLPVLDGCAAARAIRHHPPSEKTPIVALTASSRPEDRTRCRAAGMNAYVTIPIDNEKLIELLVAEIAKVDRSQFSRRPSGFLEAISLPESGRVRLASGNELDTTSALARLGGDDALYQRLLTRFLTTHRGAVRRVELALAAGDVEQAVLVTHTLAASAVNIGALHLHELARAVEIRLGQSPLEPIDALLTEFGLAEARVISAVTSLVEVMPAAPDNARAAARGTLLAALDRLQKFLRDHDTAAVDGLEVLRPLLQGRLANREPLRRLESSVLAYDFERARDDLATLRGALISMRPEAE